MESTTSREQRFREIYDSVYVDLLRFVRRRVHPSHAEDVVSEVMLVAWRRLHEVPVDLSSARPWLFGVARKLFKTLGAATTGMGPSPFASPKFVTVPTLATITLN